tara:strand:+ start:92 stop:895 length:804 start_codon:yes stop_codon:yes gene_type:complete
MKKYIYLHVACIGTWKEIVLNMDEKIKDSGLYEKVSEIRCSVIGDKNEFLSFINFDPKYKIIFSSSEKRYMSNNWVRQNESLKIEDLPTGKITIQQIMSLNSDAWTPNINVPEDRPVHNEEIIFKHMVAAAKKEEFFALYLHSKGVKRSQSNPEWYPNIKDWVDYMLHFNLYHHEAMWKGLKEHDACGVDTEFQALDGNFWWTKSEHLKALNPILGLSYTDPEFFIKRKPNTKILSVWKSKKIDHYKMPYPSKNYIGKGLQRHLTFL